MSTDWTNFREVIGDFAPGEALRGLLLLTYNFDGAWFHEMLEPEIFDRVVEHCLIIRDGRAIQRELPSFSCIRADAGYSTRIFHPKLLLGVTERRAMLAIGSSNLTRVARVGGRLLG